MDDSEKEMRVSRGLGALLANIGGGNVGVNSGEMQKPAPPKVEVPKPQPVENEGFDLSSVEGFTGWGDLNPGSNANSESTGSNSSQRNDSSRRGRNFANIKKQRKPKSQDNQLSGANCEPLSACSNFNEGREGGRNFNPLNNNSRRDGGNRDMGYKRESSQGQTDDFKRRRMDQDEDVTSWTDILEYDDEPDTEWFNEENKRLAEEYGSFVTVKYIESQPGKVGYYCELCYAEMNARKSLELHCGGMKHLKKKNLWEKNKGAAAKKEAMSRDSQSQSSQFSDGSDMDRFNRFGQSGGPYNGASSQKSSSPHEKLAGGPTGTLIKRLAECSVKHQDDAQLASEVITLLLKSLKEYHQKRGFGETAHLLDESEVKFNIIKAMQNNTQQGRANNDAGPQQGQQSYSSQYYQSSGGPSNFQPSGGPSNFQPSGGQSNFQPTGGPSNFQPTGGPSNFQPSGGPSNFQPTGGPSNFQPSGGPSNFQPSGGQSNFQPTGGPSNFQPSGGPSNFQPTGGSSNYPPSGDSSNFPPSGGPSNFQPTGGSSNLQPSGGPSNFQPTGGSSNLQPSGGPSNFQPSGGPTNYPPSGFSSNYPPPGFSSNFPPPGFSSNYPPPGGSANYPPPGATANYPPPGGPSNYQQGGGPGPMQYGASQYGSNNYGSRFQ